MNSKNDKFVRDRWSRVDVPHPQVFDEDGNRVSHVKQEFKKEVDINTIVSRMKAGQNPPSWMTSRTPRYEDVADLPKDLGEVYNITQRASESFMSLPVEMRRSVDNDFTRIGEIPRELWSRFKLLNEPVGDTSPSGKPEGAGERVLSAKAPLGANKGGSKKLPVESDED